MEVQTGKIRNEEKDNTSDFVKIKRATKDTVNALCQKIRQRKWNG